MAHKPSDRGRGRWAAQSFLHRGVHSATALIEGTPLVGHWYNRTREYAASQLRREKGVDPEQFASEQKVVLSPLPCWEHLPDKTWRRRVADLVADIDGEGARERKRQRKESLGAQRILRARPTRRPKKVEKSPRPRYHAVTELAFRRWREAFGEVLKAYREASARLREGDLNADFPEGTFPPALPFIPFTDKFESSVIQFRTRKEPAPESMWNRLGRDSPLRNRTSASTPIGPVLSSLQGSPHSSNGNERRSWASMTRRS